MEGSGTNIETKEIHYENIGKNNRPIPSSSIHKTPFLYPNLPAKLLQAFAMYNCTTISAKSWPYYGRMFE